MAAPQAFQLDPALIDEIADRLLERLGDIIVERVIEALRAEGIIAQPPTAAKWLDAKEVAQHLGFDRDWVYEHANELGVSRTGSGPRPRLRFPPHILDSPSHKSAAREASSQPAKRRSTPNGLIPIRAS
jgi:predicted DNA-binding transcriptional regulator AlpA